MPETPQGPPPDKPVERYWIKNESGAVWGPFALEAVGRVNIGSGRVQVSTDGALFRPIAEFPQLLELFERNARPPASRAPVSMRPMPRSGKADGAEGTVPAPAGTPAVARARTSTVAPVQRPGPPDEGEIAANPMPQLYSQVAMLLLTGRLTVHEKAGAWGLFFKKGVPERVECPRPGAALAEFLGKRKVVEPQVLQRLVQQAGGPDVDLTAALVGSGAIQSQALFPLLGEFGVHLLHRALTLEGGTFLWSAGTTPPPGSFPLGQRWTLLCQWVRQISPVDVRKRLGDRMMRAAYRSSGARATLEDLSLTAQEARVAAAFDGTRSPEQLGIEVFRDPDLVYRTALLLGDVGFLSFGPALRRAGEGDAAGETSDVAPTPHVKAQPPPPRREPTAPPPVRREPAAPPPRAAAPAPGDDDLPDMEPSVPPVPRSPTARPVAAAQPRSPTPPPNKPPPRAPSSKAPASRPSVPPPSSPTGRQSGPQSLDPLAKSRRLFESWKTANHFKVLGVSATAGPTEIKNAYFSLARLHHPDTVTDPSDHELRQLKEALTARVNEAYQVLSNAKARADYIREVQEGGQVDIRPILAAEEEFLRATILVKARKMTEAIALLDNAIKTNPAEAEFRAWRAFAVFSTAPNRREAYEEACAECVKVTKEAPRCAAAHLFIGQMAKIMGDHTRSEKAYRAALEIDPENIDARRELRMSNK